MTTGAKIGIGVGVAGLVGFMIWRSNRRAGDALALSIPGGNAMPIGPTSNGYGGPAGAPPPVGGAPVDVATAARNVKPLVPPLFGEKEIPSSPGVFINSGGLIYTKGPTTSGRRGRDAF